MNQNILYLIEVYITLKSFFLYKNSKTKTQCIFSNINLKFNNDYNNSKKLLIFNVLQKFFKLFIIKIYNFFNLNETSLYRSLVLLKDKKGSCVSLLN